MQGFYWSDLDRSGFPEPEGIQPSLLLCVYCVTLWDNVFVWRFKNKLPWFDRQRDSVTQSVAASAAAVSPAAPSPPWFISLPLVWTHKPSFNTPTQTGSARIPTLYKQTAALVLSHSQAAAQNMTSDLGQCMGHLHAGDTLWYFFKGFVQPACLQSQSFSQSRAWPDLWPCRTNPSSCGGVRSWENEKRFFSDDSAVRTSVLRWGRSKPLEICDLTVFPSAAAHMNQRQRNRFHSDPVERCPHWTATVAGAATPHTAGRSTCTEDTSASGCCSRSTHRIQQEGSRGAEPQSSDLDQHQQDPPPPLWNKGHRFSASEPENVLLTRKVCRFTYSSKVHSCRQVWAVKSYRPETVQLDG